MKDKNFFYVVFKDYILTEIGEYVLLLSLVNQNYIFINSQISQLLNKDNLSISRVILRVMFHAEEKCRNSNASFSIFATLKGGKEKNDQLGGMQLVHFNYYLKLPFHTIHEQLLLSYDLIQKSFIIYQLISSRSEYGDNF